MTAEAALIKAEQGIRPCKAGQPIAFAAHDTPRARNCCHGDPKPQKFALTTLGIREYRITTSFLLMRGRRNLLGRLVRLRHKFFPTDGRSGFVLRVI